MDRHMMIIVLLAVAAVIVLVYVGVGQVLPRRWRKNEVEASEDFAINSVNVLIGLLFSIPARLISGALLVALFPLLIKPHLTARLLIAVVLQSVTLAASLYWSTSSTIPSAVTSGSNPTRLRS